MQQELQGLPAELLTQWVRDGHLWLQAPETAQPVQAAQWQAAWLQALPQLASADAVWRQTRMVLWFLPKVRAVRRRLWNTLRHRPRPVEGCTTCANQAQASALPQRCGLGASAAAARLVCVSPIEYPNLRIHLLHGACGQRLHEKALASSRKSPASTTQQSNHDQHDHAHEHGHADHVHDEHCGHDHHDHMHSEDGSCCGHDHSHGGKHIYIYSPSGAVRDKAAFKRGIRQLEALGHEVEVDADALASSQRFAGDDATRLAAIHRAAASGADVALISRGGYGLTRILPGIKYKAVAKAIANGTQFVGLSDFTAFQMAMLAQAGSITWAGPALNADFGVDTKRPVSPWTTSCSTALRICSAGRVKARAGRCQNWRATQWQAAAQGLYVPGGATLWGGNLAVLVSLLGTPYFPQIDGGILFIEDVGEHPYKIERMLTQLMLAGVLQKQKPSSLGSSPSSS